MMVFDEFISSETHAFCKMLRTNVTIFLIFIFLFIISYQIISYFLVQQRNDKSSMSKGDSQAYLIAILTCSFSVSVILAMNLLLPISIISNDIIARFPNSYLLQWIDKDLIDYLWFAVSYSANLSYFLIPFSVYYLDSCGFSFFRNGFKNRFFETITVFITWICLIIGILWIISMVLRPDKSFYKSLKDVWDIQIPFIHSIVHLLSVLFVGGFSVLGFIDMLINPCSKLLNFIRSNYTNIIDENDNMYYKLVKEDLYKKLDADNQLHLYQLSDIKQIEEKLEKINLKIPKRKFYSKMFRYFIYIVLNILPIALVLFYVIYNIIGIVVGIQDPPKANANIEIGIFPSSKFGWIGSILQIFAIQFILFTNLYIFCSLELFNVNRTLRDSFHVQELLIVAGLLQLLTSAIAIKCRLLGITTFNLLGTFGNFDWLDNSVFVLAYNVAYISLFSTMFVCRFWYHESHSPYILLQTIKQLLIEQPPTSLVYSDSNHHQSKSFTIIYTLLLALVQGPMKHVVTSHTTSTNETRTST